jgi:hypothetical protein
MSKASTSLEPKAEFFKYNFTAWPKCIGDSLSQDKCNREKTTLEKKCKENSPSKITFIGMSLYMKKALVWTIFTENKQSLQQKT